MKNFKIHGGVPLQGRIKISGAKNSILPILAASLLAEGESIIEDVSYLKDVKVMNDLLKALGANTEISLKENKISINCRQISAYTAPYDLVNKMRASFLVMGPMLARTGRARIPMPGGCAIGTRPVNLHLKGFSAMGAQISQFHGYIEGQVKGRLKGAKIYLDFPSVGATENIIMAAVLADGVTVIENAAIEPEIVDLSTYLSSMGANIKGAGTDTIRIVGVPKLEGANHCVIPDRIETGTFMLAAAITGGNLEIENVVPDHIKPITAKLREAGVEIYEDMSSIRVSAKERIKAVDIKTHPYPGFPTDMQSLITSLMSIAKGTSIISEAVFENRFMHVSELKRMGANIKIEGRIAVVEGKTGLQGAQVKATDLRAGAALVIAGLAAKGTTTITGISHIERGYFMLEEKLKSVGAKISIGDE